MTRTEPYGHRRYDSDIVRSDLDSPRELCIVNLPKTNITHNNIYLLKRAHETVLAQEVPGPSMLVGNLGHQKLNKID
jgi:hypothetical protein